MTSFFIRAISFHNSLHREVNSSLNHAGERQSCAYLNLSGGNFILFALIKLSVQLNLMEHMTFCGRVITKHIKRVLTRMKSCLTSDSLFGRIFLSFFVLKTQTSHVCVKSFVCFHSLSPPFSASTSLLMFSSASRAPAPCPTW